MTSNQTPTFVDVFMNVHGVQEQVHEMLSNHNSTVRLDIKNMSISVMNKQTNQAYRLQIVDWDLEQAYKDCCKKLHLVPDLRSHWLKFGKHLNRL